MKKVYLVIFILLWVSICFGGISSYILIDNNGIDTDVFLSAPLVDFKDASLNMLLSVKRIGVELSVVTPLLMRGITINFCLTESFDLMFDKQNFSPGFGVGFSLRF
jgi:hypothetical protein